MKGQVHIAFHYVENRIPILEKVITCIREWEDETDIYVHTNNEEFSLPNVNIKVWKNLEHPFYLTFCPTQYIHENFKNEEYDFYVYTEDDMAITRDSYAYWKRYKDPRLGFFRFSGDILVDLDHVPRITDEFLFFRTLYKAFWINTREQMKEYLEHIHIVKSEIDNNVPWARERAAYGNSYGPCIIPIHELKNALVEHMGYEEKARIAYNDPNISFCKFTIQQLNDMIKHKKNDSASTII